MTWIHRLTNIDPVSRTATCAECGPTRIRARTHRSGARGWRCNGPRDAANEAAKSTILKPANPHYSRYKGDTCERCGFVAEHSCQLDVHHRDGDRSHNDPSNLQTACSNCHRLMHLAARSRPTALRA